MTFTQKRLKELFYYDPVTGVFTRLHSTSNVKAGRATGNLNTGGHLGFLVDKKMYQAHRLAWLYVHGDWPNSQIDHINGVRTDNRIENLRDVPHAVNAQNIRAARSDNKTGLLGVSWKEARGKYVAQIQIAGKVKYLGLFTDPEIAHATYIEAKRTHHPGCTI